MEQNTEPQNNPPYLSSIGASLVGSDACNVGDLSLIPWSRRSPERNSYPLQYSCLENSMDSEARGHKEIRLRYQYADFKFSKYSTFWIVY